MNDLELDELQEKKKANYKLLVKTIRSYKWYKTQAEIAEKLGISSTSVTKLLKKAPKRLNTINKYLKLLWKIEL